MMGEHWRKKQCVVRGGGFLFPAVALRSASRG